MTATVKRTFDANSTAAVVHTLLTIETRLSDITARLDTLNETLADGLAGIAEQLDVTVNNGLVAIATAIDGED